jgi:hypothetical protein
LGSSSSSSSLGKPLPSQFQAILSEIHKCENHSRIDIFKAIVLYVAYETAFIGDWIDINLSDYALNYFYSFDERIFNHCYFPPKDHTSQSTNSSSSTCSKNNNKTLTFKLTYDPEKKIVINCIDSTDIVLLNAHEKIDDNSASCEIRCYTAAFPISRYIIYKQLFHPYEACFRNLHELSVQLKELVFLPLRNVMCQRNNFFSPCFSSLTADLLYKICTYLKTKDLKNLSLTCSRQNDLVNGFIRLNKKRKFD